jgi:hypothetical protein
MRALKAHAPDHVNSREPYQKGCTRRFAMAQTDMEQQLPAGKPEQGVEIPKWRLAEFQHPA